MIGRKNRFHGHNSLNYLFRNGKSVRSGQITLKYVKAKNPDYRLAVIVSKKVNKSAVVRNRIRRRIYEIVRNSRKDSKNLWPVDMSISVYDDSVAKIDHDTLKTAVEDLLKKAKII